MEVKTEDDIGTNRSTIKKYLEPLIAFIMEHEDIRTRQSCLQICVEELTPKIGITITEAAGCLNGCIWMMFFGGVKQAELMGKLGIKGIRKK